MVLLNYTMVLLNYTMVYTKLCDGLTKTITK